VDIVNTQILGWLDAFTSAVKLKDYRLGKDLYYENGINFGTNTNYSKNIEEYSQLQWEIIWDLSRDFNFIEILDSSFNVNMGYCLVTWSNITKVKLKETIREGRATFIFKIFDGKLLAVHSHFSKYVNPADNSFEPFF